MVVKLEKRNTNDIIKFSRTDREEEEISKLRNLRGEERKCFPNHGNIRVENSLKGSRRTDTIQTGILILYQICVTDMY